MVVLHPATADIDFMMADSEASPAVESSSNSPAPKRVKKSSPTPESETKDIPEQTPLPAESKTQQQQAAPEVATDITTETLPEDDQLEAVRMNRQCASDPTDTCIG